jgi:ankyrin repeat protein/SMI1/KNR4 family protein SUKH-1
MNTPTLTAADYSDWLQFAGLYLFNVSHTDRYQTFQKKISPAGLATRIVFDFLESHKGSINLQLWRNSDVYEQPHDAKWRIEQTAKSLEAIGAPRIAARMRTLKDTSLGGQISSMFAGSEDPSSLMEKMKDIDPKKLMEEFRANVVRAMPDMAADVPSPPKPATDTEIESWEQLEHLLDRYVKSRESDLRGDMARHGDPRAEPGFDPAARMAELDRLRRAEYDREAQREDAPKMATLMDEIESKLAKDPKTKPGKLAKPRRALLDLYRKYVNRPAGELLPETRAGLEKAARFQEKYSDYFCPKPIDNDKLLARLAGYGKYAVDMGTKEVKVSWDSPNGLTSDWTTFTLSVQFRIGDKKKLQLMLDACDRMRKHFARHEAELRQQVLAHFEMMREHLDQIGLLDDYDRDEDGNPTQAAIFQNAGAGSIHVAVFEEEESTVSIQVWFGVEWDEEHGLELSIPDEPDTEPAEEAVAIANIRFQDGGPKLSAEQITAFEAKHEVKLPKEYRSFLLQHNGGRPEPNHVKVSMDGGSMPIYVEELFAIDPPKGEVEDLGNEFDIHRANDFPAHLMPIGKARMAGSAGGTNTCMLLVVVSGRKVGKIMLAMSLEHMMPGAVPMAGIDPEQLALMTAQMFESCCYPVAANVSAFLSRLTPPPRQEIPAWLEALRNGDVDAFLAAKPKLDEHYMQYGDPRMLRILDYVTLEASPAFLEELARHGVVKAKQLRESWALSSRKTARFRQLMTILGKDNLRHAFLAEDIWQDKELLDGMIAAKVDLECVLGPEGETPLHMAVMQQQADGVRWLLEHGASVKTPDNYGRTALIWAENGRHLECMKLLLEAGASLDSLFTHMPTMEAKLQLLKSRWMHQFPPLAEYLRSRGIEVNV